MSPRTTAWGAYKAIAAALRARIVEGHYPPGGQLPSEAALCAEYRVARNTVRRALDELVTEGLIAVRPGHGRVVVTPDEPSDARPAYRRMAAELRAAIEAGELRPGDVLPSESALMARHGVARNTVRRALAELEGAGLVESVQGKGRFVRAPATEDA